MNTHEYKKQPNSNDDKSARAERDSHGIKNWLMIMTSVFCLLLAIDNYKRFGIRKGPLEIVFEVVYLVILHWWLFGLTLIYCFQQILQMHLLEKLLVHNLIPEKVGMTFHAINAFFVPTACIVTVRMHKTDLVFTRLFMVYVLFIGIKSWSYAYVNSTYRKVWRQQSIANNMKTSEDKQPATSYPQNITVKNTITYMIFTPTVQYQSSYPQRTNPDWKNFTKLTLQLFIVYCGLNFLASQFILPELCMLKRLGGGGYMDRLECLLRILLPLNLTWILYHAQNFRLYLPAYAALTGLTNETFSSDWWNSADLNEFWRKWNFPVHHCLKYNIVLPLIRSGYGPATASFVAFAVAGIIHEYLNMLPFGIYNGVGSFLTLGEIPSGYLTAYLAQKLGRKCGNLTIWLYLVLSHCITILYLNLNYDVFR